MLRHRSSVACGLARCLSIAVEWRARLGLRGGRAREELPSSLFWGQAGQGDFVDVPGRAASSPWTRTAWLRPVRLPPLAGGRKHRWRSAFGRARDGGTRRRPRNPAHAMQRARGGGGGGGGEPRPALMRGWLGWGVPGDAATTERRRRGNKPAGELLPCLAQHVCMYSLASSSILD